LIKKPHIATVFLILIPFSLCFWERASTLCIFLYALAVLFQGDLAGRFREALRRGWMYPFLLLYFFHAASLLWSDDIMAGWFVLEKKASLLVLPLIIGMDARLRGETLHALLFSLIVGCAAALAFCLSYRRVGVCPPERSGEVFFYHRFSWPLDEFNAMYFSFYLFTGLAALHYLVREVDYPLLRRRWTQVILFTTLLVGLLLLSSRLFIVLTGIYVLLAVLQAIPGKMRWGWTLGLLLLTSGVFLSGFTRERFGQLLDSRFEVLRLERFEYDTPFSGLTLRLLFLKFGWEILRRRERLADRGRRR
jgi:O-antigen ligase